MFCCGVRDSILDASGETLGIYVSERVSRCVQVRVSSGPFVLEGVGDIEKLGAGGSRREENARRSKGEWGERRTQREEESARTREQSRAEERGGEWGKCNR